MANDSRTPTDDQTAAATARYSRRTMLRAALGLAGAAALAACGAEGATPAAGTTPPAGGGMNPTATTAAAGAPNPTVAPTRAATAAATARATAAGSPVAVDGKIPSPLEGVPDAYLKPLPPFKSVSRVPGRGGKVSAFLISYDPPFAPREQNRYWQELEKRMGVSPYEADAVPSANYEEKFAATLAGGDLPDLMFFNPPPNAGRILQQGGFADLTQYLTGDALKEYPNLTAFPSVLWKNVAFNKKIYGVPRPRFLANNSLYFRQDWAEKVGFAEQRNAEDVFRMFVAMSKEDPDGNGNRTDTWGLSSSSPRPGLATDEFGMMYRAPNGWRLNPDGSLVNRNETEEYKQALAFARRCWEAGAFHPDATTLTTNQNKDLFHGSKIGAYSDGLSGLIGSRTKAQELTPTAKVNGWVPVGHDGGPAVYNKYIGYFGYTCINARAGRDRERAKELLRILDYMAAAPFSEESIFNGNGIEGVHHVLKENGVREKTDLGKAEIGPLTSMTNPPQIVRYTEEEDTIYFQQLQRDLLSMAIDNPVWGFYSETNAAKSAELEQLLADRRVAIVTGREPLTAWDTALRDWKSRGGDQVRKEYEDALKAS
jgi:putative aldouronate transport system substrate-binding protein